MGAIKSTEMVVGPKEGVLPPDPIWKSFDDARESIGMGMIFWNKDKPKIHLHASIGRDGMTDVGCLRKETTIYLVIEAVVYEIQNIDVQRKKDEYGLEMLEIS